MKPLLYALALEHGWTAATMINDAELSESVGGGQHTFQNYSRRHYGLLRLREALGNSLNIPAVKTLNFVGEDAFMARLHQMGITSLTQHPDFYGDGVCRRKTCRHHDGYTLSLATTAGNSQSASYHLD